MRMKHSCLHVYEVTDPNAERSRHTLSAENRAHTTRQGQHHDPDKQIPAGHPAVSPSEPLPLGDGEKTVPETNDSSTHPASASRWVPRPRRARLWGHGGHGAAAGERGQRRADAAPQGSSWEYGSEEVTGTGRSRLAVRHRQEARGGWGRLGTASSRVWAPLTFLGQE